MLNPVQLPPIENYYTKKQRRRIIKKAIDIATFGEGHVREVKATLLLLLANFHAQCDTDKVMFRDPERVNLHAAHIWDLLEAIPD